MLERLARTMYRHRRRVVVAWVVVLVGGYMLANALGGAFRTEFKLPGTESQAAFDLLQKSSFRDRQVQGQIVFEAQQGVNDPAVRDAMQHLFAEIEQKIPNVAVVSPYSTPGQRQIGRNDPHIAYAEVNFADRSNEQFSDDGKAIKALGNKVKIAGLQIDYGGDMFATNPINGTTEAIGILAAMIILLIAFGSVLAMGLPISTALFGVGTGVAFVLMLRSVIDMPDFTTAAVAMVGIGVGIDYALFIVTRYREHLSAGLDPERSVVRAIDTAGRAVLFAGSTVVISVLGLLLMRTSVMRGVAIAIALGVAATMAASITLLPALLGFVGTNIDKFKLGRRHTTVTGDTKSSWYRWSRLIQHRPWPALIGALAVLLVLAIPLFSMRLGFNDAGSLPTSDTTRRAYDLVSKGFGPGFNGPLLLAAATPHGETDMAALNRLSDTLNHGVAGVAFATAPQTNALGDVAIMQVFPTTGPQSAQTADLVSRLRDHVIPATVSEQVHVDVGGITAAADDFAHYTATRLPIFVGAVLILSFLLLMLVFRSLLVPLKAVIMNLLSIGAAYGVIVAVFQWGWGSSLVGVGRHSPIEAWAPVFIFAVVFGLSMDYEVFLLSRIREEYDRSGDNATAVADGLALTARVITAAAAIMVCVFGSFVFGPEVALKTMGLGLAVAVLVDATIVRLVLVPATMELLGDWNWWMPKWLDRILPRVHVEAGRSLEEELEELRAEQVAKVS
jgi:RND superfamily putative drug exporter